MPRRDLRRLMMRWLPLLVVASVGWACRREHSIRLAAAPSLAAIPSGTFRAGFARVDITPPPGAGLMGLGTEGLPAVGHRQRLFARAMYLEDRIGERVAIVSLDLGESSIVLHRRVAENIRQITGVGADRLLLSATHTHSGPSHYFGMPAYDQLGSAVAAFDHALTDTLVARITSAVLQAYASRQRARAAWGLTPVWRYTRIRSYAAYRRNVPNVRATLRSRFAPEPSLPPEEAGVDPTFGMLRVDVWDSTARRFQRAGAFSVFAMHGTALTGGQRFYDADLQGRVATLLEQHIDGDGPAYAPRAVHLLVNGGHGDVSPNVDAASRCPTPRLVRQSVPRGPRGRSFETTWRILPRDVARDLPCVPLALRELERVARGVAAQAAVLYSRLEPALSEELAIRSAFTVLEVETPEADGSILCDPAVGVAALLGAEDGWTRLRWDWDLLLSDSSTYRPLPATPNLGAVLKCQGRKRKFLGPFQFAVAGNHALPEHVQLTLVRLGAVALTFIPGEPTSHSAWTIRRATASALLGELSSADSVLMVSLTNGYMQYVATPDEYPLQLYEGAATIYGPRELAVLTQAFRRLAGQIRRREPNVLSPARDTITAWLAKEKSVTRWEERPNPSTQEQPWRNVAASVEGNVIRVAWIGPSPSAFYTGEGPAVFFEQRIGGGWRSLAWDNLPEVEVQVGRMSDGFAGYTATWRPSTIPEGQLRVRLARGAMQTCTQIQTGVVGPC